MAATQPAPKTIRFSVFEVDLKAGELRRQGMRVKLQDQPFQVLAVLIEHAGEVVTKEELRQRIWPADTFVDFDHALHSAIARLREALRDSSERPQIIETLPRRGYRFIALIQTRERQYSPELAPRSNSDPLRRFAISVVAGLLGGALLLALVIGADVGGARRWLLRKSNPNIDSPAVLALQNVSKDTIIIGDFANSTGDSVFDDTLKTALTVALRQSPYLNIISDEKIATTLKLMVLPVNTKLSPQVAREVCERAGSKAYVAGSIASLGKEYVLALKAVNCQSGDTIAEEQLTANSKERVLNAIGDAAAKLRSRLGESLPSVQRFDVPLEQATTPSLEALRAFSQGVAVYHQTGGDALPYWLRAIELDPNFAMGYYAVGSTYGELGEQARAKQYLSKAFELRAHASEREQMLIIGTFYTEVTGELDKAAVAYEQNIATYPHDEFAFVVLAGIYAAMGRYDKMAGIMQPVQQFAMDRTSTDEVLGQAQLAQQQVNDARQLLHEAYAQKRDNFLLHNLLYAVAFLGANESDMAEQLQWYASTPAMENFGLSLDSDTSAYSGRLAKARELTDRAVDSAIRVDNKEEGACWKGNAALREAGLGNFDEARADVAATLKLLPSSQSARLGSGLAYAMIGDNAHAQALAREINTEYPLDTQVQSLWLPAISAQMALNLHKPTAALQQLQRALPPIEYGQISFITQLSCLYPTYIRGQAYLAAGKGNEAAAEFQKILDHSGIVWDCWTGSLARLGVARANALQAKNSSGADADLARTRALAAYKDFLALWKDADPDIPIYKEAKAEYAKLL